jgi:hypothetical protein
VAIGVPRDCGGSETKLADILCVHPSRIFTSVFIKRVYEMYMPDYLVSKEKIIKAKLIVDGILNK